jgi:hypothetical protein
MDMKQVMERIKNLQEFEVWIDLPDNFAFRGKSPFDIYITNNNVALVKVIASSMEEATQKANEFFYGEDDGADL